MAGRSAAGSQKAAQKGAAISERRLVPPPAPVLEKSCLEL